MQRHEAFRSTPKNSHDLLAGTPPVQVPHARTVRTVRPALGRPLARPRPGAALVVVASPAVLVAVMLGVAVLAGTPVTTSIGLALGWALLQLPVLLWLGRSHRRLRRRSEALPDLHDVDDLGQRASVAEASLREVEDRLHELRATVVGIAMAQRLLHEHAGRLHAATRDRLERLSTSELERLERLVSTDPHAAEPSGARERVALSEVLEPLVESVRLRGHRVVVDGTWSDALGTADEIAEILHVLLENAARHAPGSDIEVSARPQGETVVVQVVDHGPGVAPAVAPTLFQRGARAPDSPGRGLGLHIARTLARELGGDLRLEPTSPGATFTLSLPAWATAPPAPPAPPAPTEPIGIRTREEVAPCLEHSA